MGGMEHQEIERSKNRLKFYDVAKKTSKFSEFQGLEKHVKWSNP